MVQTRYNSQVRADSNDLSARVSASRAKSHSTHRILMRRPPSSNSISMQRDILATAFHRAVSTRSLHDITISRFYASTCRRFYYTVYVFFTTRRVLIYRANILHDKCKCVQRHRALPRACYSVFHRVIVAQRSSIASLIFISRTRTFPFTPPWKSAVNFKINLLLLLFSSSPFSNIQDRENSKYLRPCILIRERRVTHTKARISHTRASLYTATRDLASATGVALRPHRWRMHVKPLL